MAGFLKRILGLDEDRGPATPNTSVSMFDRMAQLKEVKAQRAKQLEELDAALGVKKKKKQVVATPGN